MKLFGGLWNSATVSALAAVLGSLAGALGSAISSWVAQTHHDRQELLVKRVSHREQMYSDFISESAKLMVDSAQHTFQDPGRSSPTYALLRACFKNRFGLRSGTYV